MRVHLTLITPYVRSTYGSHTQGFDSPRCQDVARAMFVCRHGVELGLAGNWCEAVSGELADGAQHHHYHDLFLSSDILPIPKSHP
jgi:hypothetical protein